MGNLKNLWCLRLKANQLKNLPKELANCHLLTLDITGNPLVSIPTSLSEVIDKTNKEIEEQEERLKDFFD